MNINKQLLESHPDKNFTVGREGHAVSGIVLHTMVGTIDGAQARFANPAQEVTVHYGIGLNGEIREWIQEANTAWQAGNWQVNLTTIGIEHEDDGNFNGARTDALYNSSSDLVADICRRYNIPCDSNHIRRHHDVIDTSAYPGGTACPDALDTGRIIREAAAKLGQAPAATPAPASPAPSVDYTPMSRSVTVTADTLMVRSGPGTSYPGGQANTADGNLHNGDAVDISGWTRGQAVIGNNVWLRSIHGHWFWSGGTNFPLSAVTPAPAAVLAVQVVPAPKPAAPAPSTVYTKLASPMQLQVNKNTHKWDLGFAHDAHATAVADLAQGTAFTAYGKAQRTDGDKPAYFMTEEDFGKANETGTPDHNCGVNTVDLSPIPPAAAPAPAAVSSTSNTNVAGDTAVTVHIAPTDPNGWKKVTPFPTGPASFKSNASTVIRELDTSLAITPDHPETQQLVKDQPITLAGTFKKDGITYYISENSYNHDPVHYYGIPEIAVRPASVKAAEAVNQFDELVMRFEDGLQPVFTKAVKPFASASGFAKKVIKRK